MNVWEVNTSALLLSQQPSTPAAAAPVTGSSRPDWEQLIGDPALYEELRDYFCYAQLTTQPLDTTGGFGLDGACSIKPLHCNWQSSLALHDIHHLLLACNKFYAVVCRAAAGLVVMPVRECVPHASHPIQKGMWENAQLVGIRECCSRCPVVTVNQVPAMLFQPSHVCI
jgi:hypothetical protein